MSELRPIDSPETLEDWHFPWPACEVDWERSALLVIDMQNDLLAVPVTGIGSGGATLSCGAIDEHIAGTTGAFESVERDERPQRQARAGAAGAVVMETRMPRICSTSLIEYSFMSMASVEPDRLMNRQAVPVVTTP